MRTKAGVALPIAKLSEPHQHHGEGECPQQHPHPGPRREWISEALPPGQGACRASHEAGNLKELSKSRL